MLSGNTLSDQRVTPFLLSSFPPTKTWLILIVLLLLSTCLLSQYNEREILSQQANQLLAQRQYAQAEQIYNQILDKFPGDVNAILQLLNLHFSLSQTDKAEALLQKYQRNIPAPTYDEQRILLLVMQAKVAESWQASLIFLDTYGHDESKYRRLASFFERKGFYDKVLDLYAMGSKRLGNSELFRLEIANTGMNYRRFDLAIREYLAYLDKNPVNLFFTSNQIKTILQEDSTMIKIVAAIADSSQNQVIKEVYANALLSFKDYATALTIYKQLDPQKTARFAEEQAAAGNDSIAFAAYEYLVAIENDQIKQVGYLYWMAGIKYRDAQYATAKEILHNAIELPLWKDRNLSYRAAVGVKLRKLMADTELAMGANVDSAVVWLEEAKKFARDNSEKQEMDLEIARLMIMTGNQTKADNLLNSITLPNHNELKEYLGFLSAMLFNNVPFADSLMNSFIIRYPGSPYTNDAIYLMMLTLGMQPADQLSFFSAVRLLQLNQKSGIDSLELVFSHNQDEELRLLAVEWAIGFSEFQHAKVLLNYEFKDEVAAEYAELLKLALVNDTAEEQALAREFLKAKPNSIFSPGFRQRISRWSASKPNL